MVEQLSEAEQYNYAHFQGGQSDFMAFRTILPVGADAPNFSATALETGELVAQTQPSHETGDMPNASRFFNPIYRVVLCRRRYHVVGWLDADASAYRNVLCARRF